MRVQVLKTFAGNGVSCSEGDVVSLTDEQAISWIKAGLVMRLPEEPRTAIVSRPTETAVRRR